MNRELNTEPMTKENIAAAPRRVKRTLGTSSKRRNTAQRKLVLELTTADQCAHLTADEIYELARAEDAHISRGTVYRNLNALAEAGEIRRLSMPLGPDHFDGRLDHHYHFLCRSCLRVADTQLAYNQQLNSLAPVPPGWRVEGHRLVLVGLCADCADSGADAEEEQSG